VVAPTENAYFLEKSVKKVVLFLDDDERAKSSCCTGGSFEKKLCMPN
jgi:hypothetical protein